MYLRGAYDQEGNLILHSPIVVAQRKMGLRVRPRLDVKGIIFT